MELLILSAYSYDKTHDLRHSLRALIINNINNLSSVKARLLPVPGVNPAMIHDDILQPSCVWYLKITTEEIPSNWIYRIAESFRFLLSLLKLFSGAFSVCEVSEQSQKSNTIIYDLLCHVLLFIFLQLCHILYAISHTIISVKRDGKLYFMLFYTVCKILHY